MHHPLSLAIIRYRESVNCAGCDALGGGMTLIGFVDFVRSVVA